MLRILVAILILFLFSCKTKNRKENLYKPDSYAQITTNPFTKEISYKTRFNYFNDTVEVIFWDTKDSIPSIQKENYEGFISKQDILSPDVMKKIFEFYNDSYLDYKKGWTAMGNIGKEELEKFLPRPTTPHALKKYITPVYVHIQNREECKLGTLGIEFDCPWDQENGLGVKIRNWKVVEAGVAETSYFFKGDSL